ncbi:Clp protease ClpP [Bacillus toyonensis]|uniref:head maturation protease, ClpP-related n=1 Tax=Bacillus toyonensis TaxID=155322 RepID=UPI0027092DE1|nr:head maturation protease, ClpP-related [Bacillus toyonensis]MDO8159621.1 Clp protease ClpP [Bacillus toyonensis]
MTVKIDVKGPIISNDEAWIYDLFEMDATCPGTITTKLNEANGEDIVVAINSPGGYVYEGSEIYTALKSYSGRVETQIVGLAASAASFIAMAGDKVRIAPTGQIMIHNGSMWNHGDHQGMKKAADMLRTVDNSIVNAYVIKSGKSQEELLQMMDEETWMSPQQALENKFVDEIMFMENPVKVTASSAVSAMLPQKVIDGLRNGVLNKEKTQGITKEDLSVALAGFKNEIINDIQNNIEEKPKEPSPKPVKNSGIKGLFLNL